MSITTYTQIDFDTITALINSFTNAGPNVGTAPNLTTTGLAAGGINITPPPSSFFDECIAHVKYQWDLDHSTPSTPIPATAQITKITIQQQVTSAAAPTSLSLDYTAATPPGTASVDSNVLVDLGLNNPSWITSNNSINEFDFDSLSDATPSVSADAGPITRLILVIYDILALPGDFPLGYMTKAQFVAAFTTLVAEYDIWCDAGSSGISGGETLTGSYSVGMDITSANLQVIVEWTDPVVTTWDIDTPTLTLPDDVVEISRPDPGVPYEEDTEFPEKLVVDDKEIDPNDPWIIVWTRLRIVFHLPPDHTDDPDIKLIFAGVQFSGSVPLGTLSVTTADLSGIYQLDETAHTDTLYARSGTTSTTQEVAIPAPFLVTYFIDNKETDILHYNGSRVRVTGEGDLKQVFQSLDYVNTEELANVPLRTINNVSPFTLANFIDQQCSLRIYMDDIDNFMNVSQIVLFWKKLYTGYPQ